MPFVDAARTTAAIATASGALAKGKHTPVDATSAALTMTLPTDATAGGTLSVEKVDSSANAVTVSGTLRGVTSSIPLASQYEARTFLSEGGGSWRPISDHRTASSLTVSYERALRPQSVVAFGDSIVANGAGVTSYSPRGFWVWANVLLGWRFRILANAGISGNTLTQMIARFDTDVAALSPSWIWQDGGVNDLISGRTSAQIIADFQTLFAKAAAIGARVVQVTINPIGGSFSAQQNAYRDEANAWLRSYGTLYPNVIVVDTAAAIQDPTGTAPIASLMWDSNLHPNPDGAAAMGKVIADALRPITYPRNNLPMGADSRNLFGVTGMFNGNQGNGLATGWSPSVGGSAPTYSKVARTDGIRGEWQRVVVPNGANYAGLRPTTDVPAVAGNQYYGMVEVASSGYDPAPAAGSKRFQLEVFCQGGNASYLCMSLDGTDNQNAAIPYGVLRTPIFTAPAGTTTIRLVVWCVGGGTYDMARAAVLPGSAWI